MAYIALYREWRPKDFKELVGQEHVSITLENALKKGRVAHAYLFAGPRGTGKTSTARILAKAVNCQNHINGQPCNLCDNCKNINTGRSLDVIEIDAASNRGIDEIRDIREKVNFAPTQGKYKVYIVDEVHMLTAEAFNALLKTLEDPPAHVIFILATTEIQKIPPTILSRCQRYDFKKISPGEMEERLKVILESNAITAEDGVLPLIIKKADGGLRDAISFLDQCLSYSQGEVTISTAYEVLGLVKSQVLFAITDAMIKRDVATLLSEINRVLEEGIEPIQVIRDMLEHFRNMVILLVCGSQTQLVLTADEEKNLYFEQGKSFGLEWLTRAVTYLAKIEVESRWRPNMRVVLETTLISFLFEDINYTKMQNTTQIKTAAKENNITKETKHDIKNNESESESESASINDVVGRWEHVMKKIKGSKKTVHAFLTVCEPKEISGNKIKLYFKSGYTFHKEKIEEPENIKLIKSVLTEVFGKEYGIECCLEDEKADKQDPALQKAVDIFGADIVNIKD